ncbi:hypothetical protein BYT27DRAFT_7337153 [Phlegmacium glaucopus]|nr:hypothetical protein BYT27DRAFT_7337153 [Phlegmacium glaucopus]
MHQAAAPGPYRTSNSVSHGISFAQSSFHNSRNLEGFWNAPFTQTFRELLHDYDNVLIHAPFTFSMPDFHRNIEQLKERFEVLGLHYDDEPQYYVQTNKDHYEVTQHYFHKCYNTAKHNFPWKHMPAGEELTKVLKDLFRERKVLTSIAEDNEEDLGTKIKPSGNLFDTSIDTIYDPEAFTRIPDIYVSCVAAVDLQPPTRDPLEKLLNKHRHGKKIYHAQGLIIGELKRGPKRSLTDGQLTYDIVIGLKQAARDLANYCSAYFALNPKHESITAIAACGGYWSWSEIHKEQVPEWDWKNGKVGIKNFIWEYSESDDETVESDDETGTDEPDSLILEILEFEKREKINQAWFERYWEPLFQFPEYLGDKESDEQLTELRDNHIIPALDSIPCVPDFLQEALEDAEEEDNNNDNEHEDLYE